jgi:hypothetical protein
MGLIGNKTDAEATSTRPELLPRCLQGASGDMVYSRAESGSRSLEKTRIS